LPAQTQPVQTQTVPSTPALQTEAMTQTQAQSQSQPQSQTQTNHTQTGQTQTSHSQTQTQTQTQQTQTAPTKEEEARAIEESEFDDRSEKIAELSVDQIDGFMRDKYFIYTEKLNFAADSDDSKFWWFYGAKIYNRKGKAAGYSKLASLYPTIVPKPPSNFTAVLTAGTLTLSWTAATEDLHGKPLPEGSVTYEIYRGTNADFAPQEALNPEPISATTYTDTSFQYGQAYYYFVRAGTSHLKKAHGSGPSNVLLFFPQDTFAPAAPEELNVVAAKEGMVLIWSPNPESDVAGYNIYRSTESGTGFVKINKDLVRETTYTDTTIQRRQKYFYVVTAVDSAPVPNESPHSNEISETSKPEK
jgi:hypothetical protein